MNILTYGERVIWLFVERVSPRVEVWKVSYFNWGASFAISFFERAIVIARGSNAEFILQLRV